jgi:hypothetical protein
MSLTNAAETSVRIIDLSAGTSRIVSGGNAFRGAISNSHVVLERDQALEVWDVSGTRLLRTIDQSRMSMSASAYAPPAVGGSMVAQQRGDHVVITGLDDGEIIGQLPLHGLPSSKLTFAMRADGKELFVVTEKDFSTGDGKGWVVRWQLEPAAWIASICATAGRALNETEWARYVNGATPVHRDCARASAGV